MTTLLPLKSEVHKWRLGVAHTYITHALNFALTAR